MKNRVLKTSLILALLTGVSFAADDDAVLKSVRETGNATTVINTILSPNQDQTCPGTPTTPCDHPLSERCDRIRNNQDRTNASIAGAASVREALNEAAKQTGAKDFPDLALKWLKAHGVNTSTFSKEDQNTFENRLFNALYGADDPSGDLKPKDPFVELAKAARPDELKPCDKPLDGPDTSGDDGAVRDSEMSAVIGSDLGYLKYSMDRLHGAQGPITLFNDIVDSCRDWKPPEPENSGDPVEPKPEQCQESSLRAMKRQVMSDLAAQGASPSSADPRGPLTDKLTAMYDAVTFPDYSKALPTSKLEQMSLDDLAKLNNRIADMRQNLCDRYQGIYSAALGTQLHKLADDLAVSKPAIRYLEKKYFTDQNYGKLETIVQNLREKENQFFLNTIAPVSSLSQDQVDKISHKLLNIPVFREQPIPDSLFTQSAIVPLPVFKYDPAVHPITAQVDHSYFTDATLSPFIDINADYSPSWQQGSWKTGERINLMPSLMNELDTAPGDLDAILAHEIGHMLGPEISAINGFDLRPLQAKLIACWKKEFNMQLGQQDESWADFVSAGINGQILLSIQDPKEREKQLNSLMGSLCNFEGIKPSIDDVHPDSMFRLDYIFGRDPAIRRAMGCPSVPHCTLKGEVSE